MFFNFTLGPPAVVVTQSSQATQQYAPVAMPQTMTGGGYMSTAAVNPMTQNTSPPPYAQDPSYTKY